MNIPNFMDKDDYLQNPIMRRFLKEHKLEFVENRVDYINAIKAYSERSKDNEQETVDWLLKVAKEGSKDICYRKIHDIGEWHKDPSLVEAKVKECYPECPKQNVLEYKNTCKLTMIDYSITTNNDNEVSKIEFTFSKLFLYGEIGCTGDTTVLPVFIEIYIDEGFVVSRAKAKSTLFKYDDENERFEDLISENKVNTMSYAISILDSIINVFGFNVEFDAKIVKNENSQMLYNLYKKYSFTPADVAEKVESQDSVIYEFVNLIFSNLNLNITNKEKAILDSKIFVEKFISINGNNENIFKEDRPAYLIKITADDEIELTSIDTMSEKTVPLQCTEAFFDSKKSVIKSKKCKKLHLIFKRTNETYFLKKNPLLVQVGTHKNYGYAKIMQYAEEVDIQNVLQAIFDNY